MKSENKNFILFFIESLLISFFSAFLIWLQTSKYGVGLNPDSTIYLKWADEISKESLFFILKNPDATFPPFYPIMLSIVSTLFNVNSLIAARWLNIISISIFSFLSLLLCRKLTKNLLILFAFGLFIVFSRPINLVFSYARSESLFIFILTLITFTIEKITYKRLILCGFLTSLAILARYAGVSIVPTVCLYIFIQKDEFAEKIKKCFCYATLPTLIYILYLVRNYYFTGTLMGYRNVSNTTLFLNCDRAVSTVAFWFSASFSFLAIILALFVGAFLWNYRKELKKYASDSPQIIRFSACYFLIYFVFIVTTSTITAYDLLDDRLMSPIFLSALLIVFFTVIFAYSLPHKNKILVYSLFLIFTVCSLGTFAKTVTKDIHVRKNNGAGGYASASWQENELLDYLNQHKNIFSGVVYTNNTYSFFLIDKALKPKNIPSGLNLENLVKKLPDFENSYLVYFNDADPLEYFSLTELRRICHTESLAETADGSLFRIGKCGHSTTEKKNE